MRWYVSYPILAAGLAVGFDILFPDLPGRPRPLASETVSSSAAQAGPVVVLADDLAPGASSRLAAFSPGAVLASADPGQPRTSVLDYLAATLAPLELRPGIATTPTPTPVIVTAWSSAVMPVEAQRGADAKAPARRTPASRAALARDIQMELARVGCYAGEIDGVWGRGSKRAAAVFMDRVNAALPTQEPDVFMLSLLRAQDDAVCGAACPQGQGLTAGGRCVPATLLARAGKDGGAPGEPPQAARGDARTVTAAVVPPRPVPYGRMSIGGPKPADAEAAGEPGAPAAEAPAPARTAALAAELDQPEAARLRGLDAAPTSFDTEEPPARRAKPSGRSASKAPRGGAPRYGSYRHVQRLFEHPLGRM